MEPSAYATRMRDAAAEADSIRSNLEIARISAFVLRRGVLTVRYGDGFDIDDVVARWDDNPDLLKYGVTDGQKDAEALGYIPLPQPVVERVTAALSNIGGEG